MCLILFSYKSHPTHRLIAAANRDEFYNRPTHPLSFWDDGSGILAGRDLVCNGTWLGTTVRGRFAAITNYREPEKKNADAPSRGLLVSEYLSGTIDPESYLAGVKEKAHLYNGFNLLVGDLSSLFYFSNRGDGITKLDPGTYGLSNHLINTSWPKVEKSRRMFQRVLKESDSTINNHRLLDLLKDQTLPPDHLLPNTGVGIGWERILSPVFITSESYGTRSSTIIQVAYSGNVTFLERSYDTERVTGSKSGTRMFSFHLST